MCPLGRRSWSRYANLMCSLSRWHWMAAKTSDWETGTRRLQPVGGVEGWKTSVNHGRNRHPQKWRDWRRRAVWVNVSQIGTQRLKKSIEWTPQPMRNMRPLRKQSSKIHLFKYEKEKKKKEGGKQTNRDATRPLIKNQSQTGDLIAKKDFKACEALTRICPCSWLLSLRLHLLAI